MPDNPKPDELPRATVVRRKRSHISVVWVIPIVAAVVAIGIGVQRIFAEGPTITIKFSAGQGIESGKTLLKYKDVNIGQVLSVRLADNFRKVEVRARITKSAAGLMVDGTKFWVVSPHIGLTGISGINTLLSGNYIGVQPGASKSSKREFDGLDKPPRITDQVGRRFVLTAPELGSLEIGSPIYYRFLPVGEVEDVQLTTDGKSFEVSAFITVPFDRQVHTESRFWNASGIDVSLGESGVDVRTVSLLAMLAGGVSFDTPDFARGTPLAPEGTRFEIFGNRTTAMKQPAAVSREYVLSFNEPVRGLSVGASVTLMGLVVGEVTDIGLTYDEKTLAVRPLVRIKFYPEQAVERFSSEQQAAVSRNTEYDWQRQLKLLRRLVDERGLRARLQTASLLTGQRYISFEFDPKAPKVHVDWTKAPLELPVAPGQFTDLQMKLASILAKIDQMPITTIGERAATALKTLDETLGNASMVLKDVDANAMPELKKALHDLDLALDGVNATMVGRDAPGQQALRQALDEAANAARSLRALTDYLERHPESLIRGKTGERQ